MAEREHGTARLTPRPDKGRPFARALDQTTRDHRGALAALAESERRDREAEVGHENIRGALAG